MLDTVMKSQLQAYLGKLQRPIRLIASLDDGAKSTELRALLVDIAIPLQIGCIIFGLIAAVVGFLLVRKAVNALQARRLSRRNRWFSTIPPAATGTP